MATTSATTVCGEDGSLPRELRRPLSCLWSVWLVFGNRAYD